MIVLEIFRFLQPILSLAATIAIIIFLWRSSNWLSSIKKPFDQLGESMDQLGKLIDDMKKEVDEMDRRLCKLELKSSLEDYIKKYKLLSRKEEEKIRFEILRQMSKAYPGDFLMLITIGYPFIKALPAPKEQK
ncbi:MAG: hypothetical protein PHE59_02840 [Patescibacteria group bacterium]|nr:hypothetical protein [Patescibacteria group bacterium]MDD5164200.1 hypothetical protein [Patescibacteria group bacterium]MDD5534618.1 hypothetical protein [Patescibacteria group bacterium]